MSKIQGLRLRNQVDSGKTRHLLTKEELADRLGAASTRTVDELMRRRKIPYLKLGHRTIRFDWDKVCAAQEKFEVKEVC